MKNASADIDSLIREAEYQQQSLTLLNQFERNMEYFKNAAPDLYTAFKQYQPSIFKLHFCGDYWDLLNLSSQTLIYKQEPKAYSESLVDKFLKSPFCYRISILPVKAFGSENEAHISNVNPMLEFVDNAIEQFSEPRKPPIGTECPLLMVNGIGLGHHLMSFIEKTSINHLCVVEPEPDIFFASLHTIDWQKLCDTFSGTNRSIQLLLAQTPQEAATQLTKHLDSVGLYNCTRTYIFTHLKNDAIKQTTDLLINNLRVKVGGLGYFDDERIGFAHTIENVRRRVSMLDLHRKYPSRLPRVPAIVVANGPSLDQAKDMLLRNQGKAIIISCGTALGSLRQMGIKPDLHIEMERTRPVIEWIDTSTDSEYRKDIVLLALNTVHPDVFEMFDRCSFALKAIDAGSLYLIEKLNKLAANAQLDKCNPTVGNTGLAFAVTLGFQEIYLVGLDLGFAKSGQHHSNYSAHYRIKEDEVESLDLRTADADENIVLPGNFGGQIVATPVYASARYIAEKLLHDHAEVTCFNTSRGVKIQGAQACEAETVNLPAITLNKVEFVEFLLKNHQLPELSKAIPSDQEMIAYYQPVINFIQNVLAITAKQSMSISAARQSLADIQAQTRLLKDCTPYGSAFLFVRGSIDAFLLILARCLYIYSDQDTILKTFDEAKTYFVKFLQQTHVNLTENLFTLDTRERKLVDKYKK